MPGRQNKIEELLESFQVLRRGMLRHGAHTGKNPAITPSQWIALLEIDSRGTSSVKEIASALHITSSATTQLVDSLVKSGYIIRKPDPHDRRAVSLTLSTKTKNNIKKMRVASIQKFQKMFSVLSEKEFDQYCALSKKIIAGIHK
jgi:DNA-binding MarR family transcriptional regulator